MADVVFVETCLAQRKRSHMVRIPVHFLCLPSNNGKIALLDYSQSPRVTPAATDSAANQRTAGPQ
jgi:hypothetical protein